MLHLPIPVENFRVVARTLHEVITPQRHMGAADIPTHGEVRVSLIFNEVVGCRTKFDSTFQWGEEKSLTMARPVIRIAASRCLCPGAVATEAEGGWAGEYCARSVGAGEVEVLLGSAESPTRSVANAVCHR
jgi:hypothetical protein